MQAAEGLHVQASRVMQERSALCRFASASCVGFSTQPQLFRASFGLAKFSMTRRPQPEYALRSWSLCQA